VNATEIRDNVTALVAKPFDAKTFIFRFIEAYNAPKITVTKLENGTSNLAADTTELLWKNKIYFRLAPAGKAADTVDSLTSSKLVAKYKPQFLISTDGKEVFSKDLKADDTNLVDFADLAQSYDFFLPLAGMHKHTGVAENPADIKAAGRVAKLYDAIIASNPTWRDNAHTHDLNLFMTRMLFCFFAEDTGIFEDRLFTKTLLDLTNEDGSDTAEHIDAIFDVMNLPDGKRAGKAASLRRFPYVNGGLFGDRAAVPHFSKSARRILKECAELRWSLISPDIFGSMIQAVVHPDMRGDMGMHYTSVPNIMKVLEPLFLNSLREDLEAAGSNERKLERLLGRIQKIRIFDPACGSGNFLIIAYREMRTIEMAILERLVALNSKQFLPMTQVSLSQFYGIELADFAAETAKLSLWIAEYQMNAQFKTVFGDCPPTLPLRESGNIVHGNALKLDWLTVCPPQENFETYLVGNPPYLGSIMQTAEQKSDVAAIFSQFTKNYKDLDYVSSWFLKGSFYISQAGAQLAFLATNSICQGEQAGLLWPHIFKKGLEISFAHQSFKWRNNAASNAGIICIVVGLRMVSGDKKVIFNDDHARVVSNIGPYLTAMANVTVSKVSKPLNGLPVISWGNQPVDGGHLILTPSEVSELLRGYPAAAPLVRRYLGSREFIKGIERFCLWITDENLALAESIPPINKRIDLVRASRLSGGQSALKAADTPHRFVFAPHQETDAILVPQASSERRRYLPIGIVDANCVISNLASAIYGAEPWVFAVLSSRMHIIWTAAVGGHLKSDYRYSNTLVYNTFPMPEISPAQKNVLARQALNIIEAREGNAGKTVAWLYDPNTMPVALLRAHQDLDEALEHIYVGRSFKNDTERIEHLFRLFARTAPTLSPPKKVLANA
jgi:hypothetical protein